MPKHFTAGDLKTLLKYASDDAPVVVWDGLFWQPIDGALIEAGRKHMGGISRRCECPSYMQRDKDLMTEPDVVYIGATE